MEIIINPGEGLATPEELKQYLEAQSGVKNDDLTLQLREPKRRVRGADPTVLVAVVGAAGTGLGALIAGLFQFLQRRAAATITMQTASNEKLEFPADMKPEEIDLLIEKFKSLGVRRITLD
jgi:hypothetical protein